MDSQGFRRMEIVEVSDDESDQDASSPATAPPRSSAPSSGWRRMEIVEASDDESEAEAGAGGAATSSTSPPRGSTPEPEPDIKVEHSRKGIEAAKDRANSLFSKGSLDESVRWFSKALWVAEAKDVRDVPDSLKSILHSNRAFAFVKLRQWSQVVGDCTAALRLNAQNMKARYRRATAQFELGNVDDALKDVEEVLKELPDGQNKEALELRQRVKDRLAITKPPESAQGPAGGWRRMEIVEASDDEDESGQGFQKMPVAKVSNGAAPPVRQEVAPEQELFPDIRVEHTREGLEKAKNQGNALFSQGKFEESERRLAKALWLIRSGHIKDVPSDFHSILHSNHALALTKLKRWAEAEQACTSALTLHGQNTKAIYRRAVSRFELGSLKEALHDVEVVLKELPDPQCNKEAVELKHRINEELKKQASKEQVSHTEKVAASYSSSDPFADIKVEKNRKGIEAAKSQANTLFSKGSLEESVRWFSKAIWLAESSEVPDVPKDLHSVLHSNRSFAYIKLKRWSEAEEDCSKALGLNTSNTKAKYRRAVARFEMGNFKGALHDVEQVLTELPDPAGNKEAVELKERISEAVQRVASKAVNGAGEKPPSTSPPGGWRRMNIVEASDDDDSDDAHVAKNASAQDAPSVIADSPAKPEPKPEPKPKPEPAPPASGFKRMQIVEASDDDSDEAAPAAKPSDPAVTFEPEMFPDIKVEHTKQGIEDAKKQGNALFSKGSLAESVRWFSKAIWLMQSKRVKDVPSDLNSILYSNRAFAYVKLQKWAEAEDDSSAALALNDKNSKAMYRRALSRFQLGKLDSALQDVDQVLREIPDPASNKEAAELKKQICEKLSAAAPKAKTVVEDARARDQTLTRVEEVSQPPQPPPGFKRLQIVEVSDDEDGPDEAAKPTASPQSPKAEAPAVVQEPPPGFKRMKIVDVSDDEDGPDEAAKPTASHQSSKTEAPAAVKEPAPGFKRMQIVEASDDEESEGEAPKLTAPQQTPKAAAPPVVKDLKGTDPFPDIQVECTQRGIEAAKNQANTLFAKGSLEESVRWFSKAICLVQAGRVPDVPSDLQSILHSNRAFAYIKLQKWSEAECDCSEALKKNTKNTKAAYRRALACFELGKLDAALQDVERVIQELPDPNVNKEAVTLKQRILDAAKPSLPNQRLQAREADTAKATKQESSTSRGWRRMEIVEASDDESDEAPVAKPATKVEPASPTPASQPSEPAPGFKRLQIIDASDDESDEQGAAGEAKIASPTLAQETQGRPAAKTPKGLEIDQDIQIGCNKEGIEAAKDRANKLFSEGSLEESVRWFSKAIWLVQSGRAPDVPVLLRSILHANRAFAYLKLQKWQEAEEDASASLLLNSKNTKARYRRAFACLELGKLDAALLDVEQVLKELPAGTSNKEAVDLKQRAVSAIERLQCEEAAAKEAAAKEAAVCKDASPGKPSEGWRRMEILEASDEESDTSPSVQETPAPAPGFKRMQIVEDDESDEGGNEASKPVPAAGTPAATPAKAMPTSTESELFPDIKVEHTKQGIEAAKNQANSLFAKGSLEDSVKWFSKAIWLVQKGRISDEVPKELHSILHSNRAFAYVKLRRWQEAEQDCSDALACNDKNTKAKYRRAWARYELGKANDALQDVEEVLQELPDPNVSKEAVDLKERINGFLKQARSREAPDISKAAGTKENPSSAGGWRRMEIVEASDDESDNDDPLKAAPSHAKEESVHTPTKTPDPTPGFKRMEIVEASDDESEKDMPPERSAAATTEDAEIFPDIKVEHTVQGIEAAKNHANALFSKGSLEESVRWFTKALWLAKSNRPANVPVELQSILRSNRAFVYTKLKQWKEAEQDCTAALSLNSRNTKAKYRRALARCELGKAEEALEDVEQVLKELPDPNSNKEAVELKARIMDSLTEVQHKIESNVEEPRPQPSSNGGWKRMEIVESSDDDEELDQEPATVNAKSTATDPPVASQPTPGFKRMQIIEASDDESDEENGKVSKPTTPGTSPKSPAAAAAGNSAEIFPEIKIEHTVQGIETAKQHANTLFSKGSLEDAVRWFSKAIFLVESNCVPDVSADQRSILHSNRSFAYNRLRKWADAEKGCCIALDFNPKNAKAKYRRAVARSELGKHEAALLDVEEVLRDLPDPNSNTEAVQLKQRLLEQCSKEKPPGVTVITQQATERVADATKEVKKKAPEEAQKPHEGASVRAVGSTAVATKAGGSEEDEPMPDIKLELSRRGIEQAKNQANTLFSQGSYEDSLRWFSKAIWHVEAKHIADVPDDLRSILHSNRAFAQIKLKRWVEAEQDCSAALAFNTGNTKARYRRAMACFELGKLELASRDVEQVIKELPDLSANKEARDLQSKILEQRQPEGAQEVKADVWRTLDIVEAGSECDSSSDEATGIPVTATKEVDIPSSPPPDEIFPDIRIEFSVAGIQKAKERGNLLFAQGCMEECVRWFSKAIWLITTGRVKDLPEDVHSILHSNRSFAYIRLQRWAEAEADGSAALALNSQNRKARYRRALALMEMGRLEAALEDAKTLLTEVTEPAAMREARELMQRISQSMGLQSPSCASSGAEAKARPPAAADAAAGDPATSRAAAAPAAGPATAAAPASAAARETGKTVKEVKPAPDSTSNVAEATPRRAPARGAAAVRAMAAPSLPAASPRNAFEMLRHFSSMKRHPDILARYVRERVPPQLVYSLFSKSPMEPDDLALLLAALKKNVQDQQANFGPELVADYLQQLLRSRNAETQFSMLSASEKEVLRELTQGDACKSLRGRLAALLG